MPLTGAKIGGRRLLWFCFFLCLGGAALVCVGGKACLSAWQARDWPAVPCVIEKSGINSAGKPGQEPSYSLWVSYRYSFNGQDYHCEVASFDPDAATDLKTVGAMSNRYAEGAPATCYVDPQNPTNAVLDRSVARRDWYATIGGVIMALASFTGLMIARRGRARGTSVAPLPPLRRGL